MDQGSGCKIGGEEGVEVVGFIGRAIDKLRNSQKSSISKGINVDC